MFCPLDFECIVSIKKSSPPKWVVMNYLRKVFLGLFGLSLSSLNAFIHYLQWSCTVYAVLSVKLSAMALLLPSLSSLYLSASLSSSEAGRNVNPHYLTG